MRTFCVSRVLQLRARPSTVSIVPGSNRTLDDKTLALAKDIFAIPPFPHKQVLHNWRFLVKAGKVATGPPVGQEFSKLGLKAMDFAKSINDRTKPLFKDDVELIVRIQVYFDKSYTYRIEPPPTAWFILRAIRRKRGETGPVSLRGAFCGLMTLEMCYEIAKMKGVRDFERLEKDQMIETRVRRVVGQARRMGVAIIGVDTTVDSPLGKVAPSGSGSGKCVSPTKKEYLASCERYRKIHMEQYLELSRKHLEEAPLYDRLQYAHHLGPPAARSVSEKGKEAQKIRVTHPNTREAATQGNRHPPSSTFSTALLSGLSDAQLEEGLSDARVFNALWRMSQPKTVYQSDVGERERARRYLNTRGWFSGMTSEEMKVVFGGSTAHCEVPLTNPFLMSRDETSDEPPKS